MAIEINDLIVKVGTRKVLESSGASLTDGAFGLANDAGYNRATDGLDAPDAVLDFSGAFSVAPTNGAIYVHCRPLNVVGANPSDIPDANFSPWRTYILRLNDVTTTQYLQIPMPGIPAEFDAYIEIDAGQTLSAGWTLAITPATEGPKAA